MIIIEMEHWPLAIAIWATGWEDELKETFPGHPIRHVRGEWYAIRLAGYSPNEEGKAQEAYEEYCRLVGQEA